MKRDFRLTRSTDLKRVRNSGKSYAHPLVVLVVSPSAEDRPGTASQQPAHEPSEKGRPSRVAVTGGRSVGGAVQRNRAKRLLREVTRALYPALRPGWDLVLIARKPVLGATFQQVQAAVAQLIARADLLAGK